MHLALLKGFTEDRNKVFCEMGLWAGSDSLSQCVSPLSIRNKLPHGHGVFQEK